VPTAVDLAVDSRAIRAHATLQATDASSVRKCSKIFLLLPPYSWVLLYVFVHYLVASANFIHIRVVYCKPVNLVASQL